MDKKIFNSRSGRHVDQGEKVVNVAVHAAVREQSHEMKAAVAGFHLFHGIQKHRVPEQAAVRRRPGDPGQILIDNPAGADVHVADLGVSHLSRRKPHRFSGGVNGGHGVLFEYPVQVRGVRLSDGISAYLGIYAESVHNEYHGRSFSIHTLCPFSLVGMLSSGQAARCFIQCF